jgi:dihydroflavonol-4-reductase
MSTILVTGGTGFLGSHLVEQLLEENDPGEIRILTRSYDRDLDERGIDLVTGSLTEPDDVRRAVAGVDRVYHLAGKVDRSADGAHRMYTLHVEGTRHLLGALLEEQVERIVVASTSGTVGVSESPNVVATEDSEPAEELIRHWPYYLSKLYAERVCDRFAQQHDLPIVLMRPSLLLGPGDWSRSSTGDVIQFLRGDIPVALDGGVSFVDVRDAADAFIRAMRDGEVGESYLLGAANMPLERFFERLETISGKKAPSLSISGSVASQGARLVGRALNMVGLESPIDPITVEMANHYWYVDSTKAREELGWRSRDADATLRDTVQWIREHHPEFRDSTGRNAPPEEYVPEATRAFSDTTRQQRDPGPSAPARDGDPTGAHSDDE